MMRHCYHCSTALPEEAFTDSQKQFRAGRSVGRCRACTARMNKKWRDNNPEKCKEYRNQRSGNERTKEYDRLRSYKRRYGISIEQYEQMRYNQNYQCAICGISETEHKVSRWGVLCIDHDHSDGTIRKLLCAQCNKGLGSFNDSASLLRKAAEYLEHFEKVKGVARAR